MKLKIAARNSSSPFFAQERQEGRFLALAAKELEKFLFGCLNCLF